MLYYLPNDESIQTEGIKPDFLIKHKICQDEDAKMIKELYGTERSIKYHISREEVNKIDGKETPKKDEAKPDEAKDSSDKDKQSWEEKYKKSLSEDQVVQGAINIINLLGVAKQCSPNLVNTRGKALDFLKKNFICDDGIKAEKIKN
jgi:C-terminal processing protease CtpA/Prc